MNKFLFSSVNPFLQAIMENNNKVIPNPENKVKKE